MLRGAVMCYWFWAKIKKKGKISILRTKDMKCLEKKRAVMRLWST